MCGKSTFGTWHYNGTLRRLRMIWADPCLLVEMSTCGGKNRGRAGAPGGPVAGRRHHTYAPHAAPHQTKPVPVFNRHTRALHSRRTRRHELRAR